MTRRSRSPGLPSRRTEGHRLNGVALLAKAGEAGDDSQRKIARRAGIDESVLSRLLEGARSPSLETVIALAATYGGSIEDLITRPDGSPLRIPAQAVRTAAAVG